jgi:hypothetical protein
MQMLLFRDTGEDIGPSEHLKWAGTLGFDLVDTMF